MPALLFSKQGEKHAIDVHNERD